MNTNSNHGVELIGVAPACEILHCGRNTVPKLLKKHGVSQIGQFKKGRGQARFWSKVEVLALGAKLDAQFAEREAKLAAIEAKLAPKPQPEAQPEAQPRIGQILIDRSDELRGMVLKLHEEIAAQKTSLKNLGAAVNIIIRELLSPPKAAQATINFPSPPTTM